MRAAKNYAFNSCLSMFYVGYKLILSAIAAHKAVQS